MKSEKSGQCIFSAKRSDKKSTDLAYSNRAAFSFGRAEPSPPSYDVRGLERKLKKRKLNITLTDSARTWLQEFLSYCESQKLREQPIAQLGWSKSPGKEYNWGIGGQEREVTISTKGFYLAECGGFDLCVIQQWIFDAIDNRTLDIDDEGRVSFSPPIPLELIDPEGLHKRS